MLTWIKSLFKGGPRDCNGAFEDLAEMLWTDNENPTFRRDFLDKSRLDFSLESLRHLDDYLELVHQERPADDQLFRAVLRAGGYVGEVIRRLRPGEFCWVDFDQAARHSKFIANSEKSLGSAAMLWKDNENMCFPLGKVCKFIENGREDSVYFFAKVMQQRNLGSVPQI